MLISSWLTLPKLKFGWWYPKILKCLTGHQQTRDLKILVCAMLCSQRCQRILWPLAIWGGVTYTIWIDLELYHHVKSCCCCNEIILRKLWDAMTLSVFLLYEWMCWAYCLQKAKKVSFQEGAQPHALITAYSINQSRTRFMFNALLVVQQNFLFETANHDLVVVWNLFRPESLASKPIYKCMLLPPNQSTKGKFLVWLLQSKISFIEMPANSLQHW